MPGQEIERKFLAWEVPPDLDQYPASEIAQGYLAIEPDGSEVRLRRRGVQDTLTVKTGRGRVRGEREIALSSEQFDALWPLTEGRRVEKTRYEIPADGGLVIELDVYRGELEGLVVAEVEFATEDDAERFEPPVWFGPDVTDDDAYKNRRLATDGRPA
jgi:CYTH domain-containing protein